MTEHKKPYGLAELLLDLEALSAGEEEVIKEIQTIRAECKRWSPLRFVQESSLSPYEFIPCFGFDIFERDGDFLFQRILDFAGRKDWGKLRRYLRKVNRAINDSNDFFSENNENHGLNRIISIDLLPSKAREYISRIDEERKYFSKDLRKKGFTKSLSDRYVRVDIDPLNENEVAVFRGMEQAYLKNCDSILREWRDYLRLYDLFAIYLGKAISCYEEDAWSFTKNYLLEALFYYEIAHGTLNYTVPKKVDGGFSYSPPRRDKRRLTSSLMGRRYRISAWILESSIRSNNSMSSSVTESNIALLLGSAYLLGLKVNTNLEKAAGFLKIACHILTNETYSGSTYVNKRAQAIITRYAKLLCISKEELHRYEEHIRSTHDFCLAEPLVRRWPDVADENLDHPLFQHVSSKEGAPGDHRIKKTDKIYKEHTKVNRFFYSIASQDEYFRLASKEACFLSNEKNFIADAISQERKCFGKEPDGYIEDDGLWMPYPITARNGRKPTQTIEKETQVISETELDSKLCRHAEIRFAFDLNDIVSKKLKARLHVIASMGVAASESVPSAGIELARFLDRDTGLDFATSHQPLVLLETTSQEEKDRIARSQNIASEVETPEFLFRVLTKEAERCDEEAFYWLGRLHEQAGQFRLALEAFEKSAALKHPEAFWKLAEIHANGKLGLRRDLEEAVNWLEKLKACPYASDDLKQRASDRIGEWTRELAERRRDRELLSFLTHTLRNSLASGPQTLRQVIGQLGTADYADSPVHKSSINQMVSLFSTFLLTSTLIDVFKQSVSDPESLQKGWREDGSGDATPRWVIAAALRQCLCRLLFALGASEAAKWLPDGSQSALTALRQSFIETVLPLEDKAGDVDALLNWIPRHFPSLLVEYRCETELHFQSNQVRYALLFSIVAELAMNALLHGDGQSPIRLCWRETEDAFVFEAINGCKSVAYATNRAKGTNQGLFFIRRILELLGNTEEARLEWTAQDGTFVAVVTLAKSLFGPQSTPSENPEWTEEDTAQSTGLSGLPASLRDKLQSRDTGSD